MHGVATLRLVSARPQKLMAFRTRLSLYPSLPFDVLALGTLPVLQADGNGLVARVARNHRDPTTETREAPLYGAAGQRSFTLSGTAAGEADFVVTQPGTYKVRAKLISNGNLANHPQEASITITSLGTDVAPALHDFVFVTGSVTHTVPARISYHANPSVYDGGTHIIRLSVAAFNTGFDIFHLVVDAYGTHEVTTTYPDSYRDEVIAHPHDNDVVSVLLLFETVTGTDGIEKLAVRGVINGNQFTAVNLNTQTAAYDFTQLHFGGGALVSHLQVYDYTLNEGATLTQNDLLRMYEARDAWLGLFAHPTIAHADYALNGSLEIDEIAGLVLRSENGKRWKVKVGPAGGLSTEETGS